MLAAIYVLVLYQRTMTGPVKAEVQGMADLKARELVVVVPLIALLLFLGVYPKPLTEIVNPAVQHTMSDVQKKDPPARGGGRQVSATAVHSLWTTASGGVTSAAPGREVQGPGHRVHPADPRS